MLIIDQLAYSSRLRHYNPCLKAGIAVALLLAAVFMQSIWIGLVLSVLMGILSVKAGGTPIKQYMKLLKIPAIFILLSLVAIVLNLSAEPLSAFAVRIGNYYITGSLEGILKGARLAASAMGGVSCMYALSLSTPLTDLFYVLNQIRCPQIVIELMLLIYRFIFVLLETADSLTKAQKSRLGNRNFKTSIRSTGQLFAMLFIRAMKRSSALYDAMESRGYDGTIRVLYEFERGKK